MEEFMKNGNFIKRMGAVFLAVAVAASSIIYSPVTTEAVDYNNLVTAKEASATANTDITYEFSAKEFYGVAIMLVVPEMVSGTMSVFQNGENDAVALNSDAETWGEYDSSIGGYGYTTTFMPYKPADCSIVLNFNTDTTYSLVVIQEKPAASMDKPSLTLTEGFTDKLKANGVSGRLTWASSNNKVATVNSAGKVTAKKTGSAKITATSEDGSVATCAVVVKKNEYSETKQSALAVPYGGNTLSVQVYKMLYKGGNLVLKINILNNTGTTSTGMKKASIVVRDGNGKKVGTCKIKAKKFTLHSGSSKTFTYTIKKKDLKIKKADLRNVTYDLK